MQDKYKYSTRVLAKKYAGEFSYYARKLQLLELPNEIQKVLGRPNTNLTQEHCRHICKLLNKDKLQKKFEKLFAIKFEGWDEKQVKRFNQEVQHRQQATISSIFICFLQHLQEMAVQLLQSLREIIVIYYKM